VTQVEAPDQLRGAAERILMIALKHKSPATYEERVTAIVAELHALLAKERA
jgi:hypothetical protein